MAVNKAKILAEREARRLKVEAKTNNVKVKEGQSTINPENFKEGLGVKTHNNVTFSNIEKKRAVNPSGKPGVLSIIYSTRNGKRYQFSNAFYKKIGEPPTVQIGFTDTSILVSEKLDETAMDIEVKFSQNRPVIYSASLVEDAIIKFDLAYEDGCVSKTFSEAEYYKDSKTDAIVAEIKITIDEAQKEDKNNEA